MPKSKTFNYTAGYHAWKCPANVTSITIDLVGAAGGGANTGGYPGRVLGTMTTVPGTIYFFSPGGKGGAGDSAANAPGGKGGWNGGGAGGGIATQGGGYRSGYGGGGESDVRVGGHTLAHRTVIAAGGGGAIGSDATVAGGAGGANTGGAGTGPTGGGGGTQVAGGAAGNPAWSGSIAGVSGQGGYGGGNGFQHGPGGGGGGYFGGGGGGDDTSTGANPSGGGGGSNYTTGLSAVLSNTQGYSSGGRIDGYIRISYNIAPRAVPRIPVTHERALQAATYTFKWLYRHSGKVYHSATNFRYRRGDITTWTTVNNANVVTTVGDNALLTYVLTATLTAGVEYEWQVQSKSAENVTGDWSLSSYFTPMVNPALIPPRETGSMEIEVYHRLTGVLVDNLSRCIAPTYVGDLVSGAGSITLMLNDAKLVATPDLLEYNNVVVVKVNNRRIGWWIILKKKLTLVSEDEHKGLAIVCSGVGEGGWYAQGNVYPEVEADVSQSDGLVGTRRSGSIKVRPFNFTAKRSVGDWYDEVHWLAPTQQSLQGDVTAWNAVTGTGNPWAGGPSSWPLPTSPWIAGSNSRLNGVGLPGYLFYRREFYLDQDVDVVLYLAFDNELVVYIDGVQITKGNNWTKTLIPDLVSLGPGMHTLAIEGQNYSVGPEGLLCAVAINADSSAGVAGSWLFDTSWSGWSVVSHPGLVPGWSVGDILNTLVAEAQARDIKAYSIFMTTGFSAFVDSLGDTWPADGNQWQFGVGVGLNTVIDTLRSSVCDIWIDANFVLHAAWARGFDRSILYAGDTFSALVQRDTPFWFFPFSTAAGAVTGGTGWNDTMGTSQKMITTGTAPTYVQAMPSPTALTGMNLPLGSNQITATQDIPAGTEYSFEWLSAVGSGESLQFVFATDQTSLTGISTYYWLEILLADDGAGTLWISLRYTDVANDPGTNPTSSAFQFNYPYGGYARDTKRVPSSIDSSHYVFRYKDSGAIANLQLLKDKNVIIEFNLASNSGIAAWDGATGGVARMTTKATGTGNTVPYADALWYTHALTDDEVKKHFDAAIGLFNPVTQPVIFSPGMNVLDTETEQEFRVKTVLTVASKSQTFEQLGDDADIVKYGRIEGFYDGSSFNPGDARRIADKSIDVLNTTLSNTEINISGIDYIPFRDFDIGDWVLAPPDDKDPRTSAFSLIPRRVVGINVARDELTGRVLYGIELDSIGQTAEQKLNKWLARAFPDGNLNGLLPVTLVSFEV